MGQKLIWEPILGHSYDLIYLGWTSKILIFWPKNHLFKKIITSTWFVHPVCKLRTSCHQSELKLSWIDQLWLGKICNLLLSLNVQTPCMTAGLTEAKNLWGATTNEPWKLWGGGQYPLMHWLSETFGGQCPLTPQFRRPWTEKRNWRFLSNAAAARLPVRQPKSQRAYFAHGRYAVLGFIYYAIYYINRVLMILNPTALYTYIPICFKSPNRIMKRMKNQKMNSGKSTKSM